MEDTAAPAHNKNIQREVQQIRDQLVSDLERWELALDMPPTGRAGVHARVFREFEILLSYAAQYWSEQAGESGLKIVNAVSRGKTLDRLTLGQKVAILRRLYEGAEPKTRSNWHADDLETIQRIIKRRNDFAHGRISYHASDSNAIQALFSDIRTFGQSAILTGIGTIEVRPTQQLADDR